MPKRPSHLVIREAGVAMNSRKMKKPEPKKETEAEKWTRLCSEIGNLYYRINELEKERSKIDLKGPRHGRIVVSSWGRGYQPHEIASFVNWDRKEALGYASTLLSERKRIVLEES